MHGVQLVQSLWAEGRAAQTASALLRRHKICQQLPTQREQDRNNINLTEAQNKVPQKLSTKSATNNISLTTADRLRHFSPQIKFSSVRFVMRSGRCAEKLNCLNYCCLAFMLSLSLYNSQDVHTSHKRSFPTSSLLFLNAGRVHAAVSTS